MPQRFVKPQSETRKLISIFLPNLAGGGAERSMVALANGFARRGLKVHLVLAQTWGVYFDEIDKRVQLVELGAKRVLFSLLPLSKYLKQTHPYALISALDHTNLIAIWARLLSQTKTRLIVSVRAVASVGYRKYPLVRFRSLPFLMRMFYRYSDAVVAVSQGVADDLVDQIGLCPEKLRVIYNPMVDECLFEEAQKLPPHPWFRGKQKPIILGVGRLDPQKDFATLLRAFK